VFSFVVLILQFGSSQYSPRTVSYFLRAKSTRHILAIFLATITFLGLLDVSSGGRADFTPDLTVVVAVGLLFASLVAFIVLLHCRWQQGQGRRGAQRARWPGPSPVLPTARSAGRGRSLSPGVNDPTTAVRALDEIEGALSPDRQGLGGTVG
jgi:uncharacterized membrane protein